MFFRHRCVLDAAVLLLLLSLFSGTTALLFPNGQQCQFASECESGACSSSSNHTCVDKIALGGICTLEAPCANPETTTCNFKSVVGVGLCEVAKRAGEVCSNDFPQRRCIEPQLRCIQRVSSQPPSCLTVLANGEEKPNNADVFFCDTSQIVKLEFGFGIGDKFFCSNGDPGDICNAFDGSAGCRGPDCFENKCGCLADRCFKFGFDGDDCSTADDCAPELKCLIVRRKCTAGVLGSPCTLSIDCGKVIGSVLECSGGFCVKRGGIGQPCTGGAAGLTQGSCLNGLRCSGRRGTCGCRPVLGCP